MRAEKTEKREKRRPASAGAARDARDGWGALRGRSVIEKQHGPLEPENFWSWNLVLTDAISTFRIVEAYNGHVKTEDEAPRMGEMLSGSHTETSSEKTRSPSKS